MKLNPSLLLIALILGAFTLAFKHDPTEEERAQATKATAETQKREGEAEAKAQREHQTNTIKQTQDRVSSSGQSYLPKWFTDQPPLCGIGAQKIRSNIGAAKSLVESQARYDLAQQLEIHIKKMIRQYNQEESTEGGEISEELSKKAAIQLTKQTIKDSAPQRANIMDRVYYTLVCLEPDTLTHAIYNMKAFTEAQRKALARRAAIAHEELKEAIERMHPR